MGRAAYLDVAPEIIERPLHGRLVINARGEERRVPAAIEFFRGAATFPWRSQALWIAESMASRTGADREVLRAAARASFRPDLYRSALGPVGRRPPRRLGEARRRHGVTETEVASTLGTLLLGPEHPSTTGASLTRSEAEPRRSCTI